MTGLRNARRLLGLAAGADGAALVAAFARQPYLAVILAAIGAIATIIVTQHLLNLEERR